MLVEMMFIGKPKQLGSEEASDKLNQSWISAINRDAVSRGNLTEFGFEDDEVADKVHHGGVDKAVFCYASEHYPLLRNELNKDMQPGGFGENLSVVDMNEQTVCLGDIYQIGNTLVQVTQPRKPCWKPARKYREIELSKITEENGRTGWYLKVLRPGVVSVNDKIELLERSNPEWTIAKCNEVMHFSADLSLVKELSEVEVLAYSWKVSLKKKLSGEIEDKTHRLYGPNI